MAQWQRVKSFDGLKRPLFSPLLAFSFGITVIPASFAMICSKILFLPHACGSHTTSHDPTLSLDLWF